MPHAQYILFESASGFGLFEVTEAEEIGALLPTVQASISDASKFGQLLKLKGFMPFNSAANALENANHVSEGLLPDDLKTFLEQNLPRVKPGKKAKFFVGVVDPKIGNAIQDELNVPCNSNETVLELIRGVRQHLPKFIKQLDGGNMEKAQLGLAHSYSRAKVKFNVNKSDNMIIQAICLLDQLDKDLNTFAMRVREWYSWHFPELVKLVKDNFVYARVAQYIGDRAQFPDEKLAGLTELVDDEDVAKQILEASRSSMGMDISPVDLTNIDAFATRLISLATYRQNLYKYLEDKMAVVAPNLAALIGEVVAARLISHAGSLTNLAKCPASTVQILGAEKALFRALKTRGNTPKYGLIFHSSFIGRAAAKNKGRISRYLANKCSMAARIDSFADYTTTKYGERLRDQVEERLKFYDSGVAPAKNIDVMAEVAGVLRAEGVDVDGTKAAAAKAAARAEAAGAGGGVAAPATPGKKDKKKKKKKDKKRARDADEDVDMAPPKSAKKAKKDKKKKKKKSE